MIILYIFNMKNIILLVLLTSLSLITGCENRRISHDIQQLVGSKIEFPQSLRQVAGRETRSFAADREKAHVLVYYDSTACGTCAINKLSEWDPIIDSVADICPAVDFIFLMCPKAHEYKSVLRTTIINNSDYNVALDAAGDFAESNPQIPQDERFHTLLIDRGGTVQVVGSPLYNDTMWKLYKDVIQDMCSVN